MSQKKVIKIYLAGPEVMFLDAGEKAEWKNSVIHSFNKSELKNEDFEFKALVPLNEGVEAEDNLQTAMKIYHKDLDLMKEADMIIANMTQYRGASMDGGTAFEMGFMTSLNKPVIGYYSMEETYGPSCGTDQGQHVVDFNSDHKTTYLDKLQVYSPVDPVSKRDQYGHAAELFQLSENLMMVGSVLETLNQYDRSLMSNSFHNALKDAAVVAKRVF